jgi:hypothetical protein
MSSISNTTPQPKMGGQDITNDFSAPAKVASKKPPLPGRSDPAKRKAAKAAATEALAKVAAAEMEAGKERAAATAALQNRLEQERKQAAAEHREADAAAEAMRKSREKADAAAHEKKLSRISGSGCQLFGACGGMCTYCLHVNPNSADRLAGALDGETGRAMYGNSTPDAIKRAYARAGGGGAGEWAVRKLVNKGFR